MPDSLMYVPSRKACLELGGFIQIRFGDGQMKVSRLLSKYLQA